MKIVSAFITLFLLCSDGNAQQTDSLNKFSKAKALINKFIAQENVPSISIAVVRGENILWEESFGFADREQKRKATIYTPYYLASLSKTITATGVMKLLEKGLVQLDSPINNYLSSAKVRSFMWDTRGATVRRILSHTSGLTTFNSWCREDSSTCAKNDSIYISRYAVLILPPGKRFDYTNLGYGLLDRMISNVSKNTFPDYMQREVFKPLSMKNSYVATDLSDSDRAIRYSSNDLTRFEFDFSHSYSAGASLIYASVHDLALFSMLHLNPGSNTILSQRSVNAMQDTVARNGSDYYGLGWWIRKDFNGYKSVLGQGGTFFANAWLQLIPSEDIAIAILANSGGGDMSAVINEVLAVLLPEFKKNLERSFTSLQKQDTRSILPPASKWSGSISTYKGDVPVTFYFNGAKRSYADVGNARRVEITKVETNQDWYSFTIEGDLGLEDTGHGPYNLTFYLNQKGSILYGSVETSSSVHSDTPQLAYWVKLKQAR